MNTPISTLNWRSAAALLSAAFIAGCAHAPPGGSASRQDTRITSECRWSQSSCNYDGQYEPGERDYAEQEARRLNQAQLQRLQRGAIQ